METEAKSVFRYDSVLNEEDLCNYTAEKKSLTHDLAAGKRLVLFGRRNTGKTSIIKSCVIPQLRKKGHFVLFADFYGVQTLEQVKTRLNLALQSSLLETYPIRSRLDQALNLLTLLRPVLHTDPTEGLSLTLHLDSQPLPALHQFFKAISSLKKKSNCTLIFDEFQDIHHISECEALFRDALQNLPAEIGVMILGSKKHLLGEIFARPHAPLAGFGEDRILPLIPYHEYTEYIQKRFLPQGLSIEPKNSEYLQNFLQRIPESINIVCEQIRTQFSHSNKKEPKNVTLEMIHTALKTAVDVRRSRFEEYLSHYTDTEQKVMTALANEGPVESPSGKDFVAATGASQKGVSKIIKKLENEAVVYHIDGSYILADPLMAAYLRKNR
mgnify:CR=1 FL=1